MSGAPTSPGQPCLPSKLVFCKEHLTPEETIVEIQINEMLPHPHHSKLNDIKEKHATRCIAATIHMLIHKAAFNTKTPQSKGGPSKETTLGHVQEEI